MADRLASGDRLAFGDRIAPTIGDTIGILGGGQLGRMIAMAAASLGLKTHVFTPEADSPAAEVAGSATVADYRDEAALARFAATVAVVTYEFENVPAETAAVLARHAPVRPNERALQTAQDRLVEKAVPARSRARNRALRPRGRSGRAGPRRGPARPPLDPEDAPLRL